LARDRDRAAFRDRPSLCHPVSHDRAITWGPGRASSSPASPCSASREAHHFPPAVNCPGILGNRVTELALPFLYVAPKPIEPVAGLLTVAFQGWLLPTGKVSWLNWLTVVLAVSTFEDAVVAAVLSLLAGLLDGDDGLRSPPDRPVRQRTAAIRSDAP